jgi:hypothetical protein
MYPEVKSVACKIGSTEETDEKNEKSISSSGEWGSGGLAS